jgi:tetratricopeptide (TPR) repeat protein
MYTATSGIWQTVWLETVPAAHISNLVMTPSLDSGHLRLSVNTAGNAKDYTIEAIASNGSAVKGKPGAQLLLPVNNAHLWSPEDPFLYNLNVRLLYKGKVIDTVGSYFGMRKIEVKNDDKGVARLFLNNKYTYHLGVLDQGFWPEGLYTAPTDEALKFDILAIKNMGYNTIRKHIKLEPARWYYHADKIGMLVWQDMVTCAGDSPDAHEQFEKENKENIAQLHNYPSIVLWVLFNEGWARYDQQRLTEWMKKADPSRVVDGHTGENYDRGSPQNPMDKWASSDMTDIHDYPGPGIAPSLPGKARVLGEWGGVRVVTPKHQWNGAEGWGYIQVTPSEFAQKYEFMLKHLKVYEEEGLSGSIYTEPFDVETEENGMMSYDREVIKIPAEKLRQIHRSLVPAAESYAWNGFKAMASDTTNPDRQYASLLQEYKQGKNDSAFLYDLAMMAVRMNDKASASLVANAYIKGLHNPFTKNNMNFVQQFTQSSSDQGFQLFLKQPEKVNEILGASHAEQILKSIIGREEIDPYLNNAEPDWNKIITTVTNKYGNLGKEKAYGARMIYSFNNKDWPNFGKYYGLYYTTAYDRSEYHINNMSWPIFQHVTDTLVLAIAVKTVSYSLKMFDQNNANAYDTYANILYKLGKREEAIQWEKKALSLDPNSEWKKNALKKMIRDEPTWK